MPGCITEAGCDRSLDIVSVFEAVGAHANDKISDEKLAEIERNAIPGAGSCGGMYTANTMASAIEAMGMSLPNSSAQAATSPDKSRDCESAGRAVLQLIEQNIRPLDIMTRHAFENAITVVIALGGSTNAVLHLLAMAHSCGVELQLDDFTEIGKKVPVLGDLKPSGKYEMIHLVRIGGLGSFDENLARCRFVAWRLFDGDRKNCGRKSGRGVAISERSGCDSTAG